ncbi:protein of unknown function [Nitrospina watsonii]|uniref:Uncharacterized protein n=1 Tax=Nitrospina watsonii TaxID=1323948 RepID=A0ABM9HG90_9BACT|nr:protein of unknown function [Nitrospina watsonii]
MAGPTRLELATSGVTGRRSNQLNYDPALVVGDGPRPRAASLWMGWERCHKGEDALPFRPPAWIQ